MADPTAVKRALRALACGGDVSDGPAHRQVIEDAAAALDAVDDAAQFRETQGLSRLRSAVRTATRRDDRTIARTGRRTLSAFDAYRRAAAGTADTGDVHFRSGHGTSLPVAGQGGDR